MLAADIIKPIAFLDCLSNPMIVAKPLGGACYVCINFTDLNKAVQKKLYPLPLIDQLVDSIVCHELLSFLDAYKGYLQIPIAKEDMGNTVFVIDDGIYSYTRIPFGLKNVGTDFQEGMNKAFQGLIGKIIEVYVDDIIVKSKKRNLL